MAASLGLVSGLVRDASGRPIAGARVSFTSGPVALPDIAALTDGGGAFTLTASAPGTYEVEAVADGFASRKVSVVVGEGGRAHANFRLEDV